MSDSYDDVWNGVGRDEFECDRLLDAQDWADWRAIRGWEASRRPTRDEMVEHMAAERREYERQQLEGVAERAAIHDGWATHPDEIDSGTRNCVELVSPHRGRLRAEGVAQSTDGGPAVMPSITVHATLTLTGCGDPTIDELRAQLAGLGFDTIDIEEVA